VIRVCLVEDQTLVRQGIQSLLELTEDIRVVGIAEDGEEGPHVIERMKPDVVLLDMRLPKANGLEVLRALQRSERRPPAIILTTFDDDAAVLDGMRAGAKGFLLKDVSLEQLATAIRTVANGGTLINPMVTERILRSLEKTAATPRELQSLQDPLTTRETEILRLMTGGYSNLEIAGALQLSEGTVKNHVSNILSKLGVRDRTRAVLKAIQAGYI
jgi:DNA-binding NarL/FixJ family response regulator